jgi:hypothetical protein
MLLQPPSKKVKVLRDKFLVPGAPFARARPIFSAPIMCWPDEIITGRGRARWSAPSLRAASGVSRAFTTVCASADIPGHARQLGGG